MGYPYPNFCLCASFLGPQKGALGTVGLLSRGPLKPYSKPQKVGT